MTAVAAPPIDLPDGLAGACLGLDFDGTLVDLAPTPDAVEVPPALADTLTRLAARMGERLVIVTGRDVASFSRFLPHFDGALIASHGAEHRVDGEHAPHPLEGSEAVAEIWRRVAAFTEERPGTLLERKPLGAGLHYRLAPEQREAARMFTLSLLPDAPEFEIHEAKMAYEIRPKGIGKGAAFRDWLARPAVHGAIPIFVGDDTTDEPAMEVAQAGGGFAIKVGPGESCARHRLSDPGSVRALLDRWLAEG